LEWVGGVKDKRGRFFVRLPSAAATKNTLALDTVNATRRLGLGLAERQPLPRGERLSADWGCGGKATA